jgi:hypothetical protein
MYETDKTVEELKAACDKELMVIGLFTKNALCIGDKKIYAGLSLLAKDSLRHYTLLVESINSLEKKNSGQCDSSMNKEAHADILADFLKEEKGVHLRYQKMLPSIKEELVKSRVKEIDEDEIRHQKIVQELMDYLG